MPLPRSGFCRPQPLTQPATPPPQRERPTPPAPGTTPPHIPRIAARLISPSAGRGVNPVRARASAAAGGRAARCTRSVGGHGKRVRSPPERHGRPSARCAGHLSADSSLSAASCFGPATHRAVGGGQAASEQRRAGMPAQGGVHAGDHLPVVGDVAADAHGNRVVARGPFGHPRVHQPSCLVDRWSGHH